MAYATYYLYDGDHPVCELNPSTGAVKRINTWGANGLLSRSQIGGSTSFYAFDLRGNAAQITDSTGAVTISLQTDGFGQVGASDGSTSTQGGGMLRIFGEGAQWGYAGDGEDGLILCTHRFYDPSNGRWLTRDPISYAGGINLYGYVQNDPINDIDPNGTIGGVIPIPITPVTAGAAAVALALLALMRFCHEHPEFCTPTLTWPAPSTNPFSPGPVAPPIYPSPPVHMRGGKPRGAGSNLPGPSAGGPPNGSCSEDLGGGKGTIRDYGPDGKPTTDYDFGHNHPPRYPGDPHGHDWSYPKGGKPVRGPGRPILPGE